jgi:hypothetical protein
MSWSSAVALEGVVRANAPAYATDPNSYTTWAEITSLDFLTCQECTDGLIKLNGQCIVAQSPRTSRGPHPCILYPGSGSFINIEMLNQVHQKSSDNAPASSPREIGAACLHACPIWRPPLRLPSCCFWTMWRIACWDTAAWSSLRI